MTNRELLFAAPFIHSSFILLLFYNTYVHVLHPNQTDILTFGAEQRIIDHNGIISHSIPCFIGTCRTEYPFFFFHDISLSFMGFPSLLDLKVSGQKFYYNMQIAHTLQFLPP